MCIYKFSNWNKRIYGRWCRWKITDCSLYSNQFHTNIVNSRSRQSSYNLAYYRYYPCPKRVGSTDKWSCEYGVTAQSIWGVFLLSYFFMSCPDKTFISWVEAWNASSFFHAVIFFKGVAVATPLIEKNRSRAYATPSIEKKRKGKAKKNTRSRAEKSWGRGPLVIYKCCKHATYLNKGPFFFSRRSFNWLQRGGFMDKTLALSARRSGLQILGRGKCSLKTIAAYRRIKYPLF